MNRLRLENYSCIATVLRGVARRAPLLETFVQEAGESKEESLLFYIQQQLEYAKTWKMLEFSQVPTRQWSSPSVAIVAHRNTSVGSWMRSQL